MKRRKIVKKRVEHKPSKKLKKITRLNKGMKYRMVAVIVFVAIFMIGLVVRMVYIIQNEGEVYSKRVLDQQSYSTQIVPYKRGNIYDRK